LSTSSRRHGENFSSPLLQKTKRFSPALIPLDAARATRARPASTRTFFFSGPKSYNASSNPVSGPFVTHRISLISPLVFSGNRVSRYRETCGHGSRATQNPETRWVRMSTLSVPVGDFPIGKSAHTMSRFTCTTNLPNPELRYARALSPCHVTSSLSSIGNRVIAISKVAIPLHWKIPNAEPRFSGLQTRVQLGIHGPNLFGKSQIAISKVPLNHGTSDIPMS
jgi:hypothetical protein